jgi:hypothetical protein
VSRWTSEAVTPDRETLAEDGGSPVQRQPVRPLGRPAAGASLCVCGSPDAAAYEERGGIAVQALAGLRLGSALSEQHLDGAANVSLVATCHGTEARKADELPLVGAQEGLDLVRHSVSSTTPAGRSVTPS